MAPEQWHVMQPNWPSDRGEPRPRPRPPDRRKRRRPDARRAPLAVLAVGARRGAGPGARARPGAARARRRRPRHRSHRRPAARARGDHGRPERRRRVQRQRSSPMAQDQTIASERTLEALRVFEPDVLHLHEPLVPGPDERRAARQRDPEGRHVPRRVGETGHAAYKALRKIAVERGRAGSRSAPRSAPTRARMAEEALGGSYLVLPNGVDVDAVREGRAGAVGPTGGAVPRPSRAAQGARRAARRVGRPRPRRGALGRVRRSGDRGAARPGARRNVEWLGRITDHEKLAAAQGRHGVLRAGDRPGVVRHRAARGDGRRHLRARVGHPRLRERRPPRRRPPGWSRRTTPTRCAPGCAGCSMRTICATGWWRRARRVCPSSRCTAWPSGTSRSTSRRSASGRPRRLEPGASARARLPSRASSQSAARCRQFAIEETPWSSASSSRSSWSCWSCS